MLQESKREILGDSIDPIKVEEFIVKHTRQKSRDLVSRIRHAKDPNEIKALKGILEKRGVSLEKPKKWEKVYPAAGRPKTITITLKELEELKKESKKNVGRTAKFRAFRSDIIEEGVIFQVWTDKRTRIAYYSFRLIDGMTKHKNVLDKTIEFLD